MASTTADENSNSKIGFKQLFDTDSSTYTYLLWDEQTKDAILIDPVDIQVDRDLNEVKELGLNLIYGWYVFTLHRPSLRFTFTFLCIWMYVSGFLHY